MITARAIPSDATLTEAVAETRIRQEEPESSATHGSRRRPSRRGGDAPSIGFETRRTQSFFGRTPITVTPQVLAEYALRAQYSRKVERPANPGAWAWTCRRAVT